MRHAQQILAVNDNFPIRTHLPVHNGKVRAVYWLTAKDSERLIKEKNYPLPATAELAVMIISDRISAFDCIWRGENGLNGVPGKGAALNAIASHWFALFNQQGLADNHIVDIPHPLVWVVQKAKPIKIEAICRSYITGSMWRAYQQGEREFCGIELPEALCKDSKLEDLLLTPSTKGILTGIDGVPESDDVNISRAQIEANFAAFNFNQVSDIDRYEDLLKQGFKLIEKELSQIGQLFVDTKFEFGYVKDCDGNDKLIYMDEVGTPDSSRLWDAAAYQKGQLVENSKEGFRQFLLNLCPDKTLLLDKDRMAERLAYAQNTLLPTHAMLELSDVYLSIARKITGKTFELSSDPRAEIIDILKNQYQLIAD